MPTTSMGCLAPRSLGKADGGATLAATLKAVRQRRTIPGVRGAMQLTVSSEAKKFIDAEVERGHYASPSELVERAIEALREQEEADERQLADLREQIAVARAQAERGEEIQYRDGAELLADIRARRSGQR